MSRLPSTVRRSSRSSRPRSLRSPEPTSETPLSTSISVIIRGLRPNEPIDRFHPPGAVVLFSDGAQTAGGTLPVDATATAFVYAIPDQHGLRRNAARGRDPAVQGQQGLPDLHQHPCPGLSHDAATNLGDDRGHVQGRDLAAPSSRAASRQLAAAYKTSDLRSIDQDRHSTHDLSPAAGGVALAFIAAGIILSGLWFGRHA